MVTTYEFIKAFLNVLFLLVGLYIMCFQRPKVDVANVYIGDLPNPDRVEAQDLLVAPPVPLNPFNFMTPAITPVRDFRFPLPEITVADLDATFIGPIEPTEDFAQYMAHATHVLDTMENPIPEHNLGYDIVNSNLSDDDLFLMRRPIAAEDLYPTTIFRISVPSERIFFFLSSFSMFSDDNDYTSSVYQLFYATLACWFYERDVLLDTANLLDFDFYPLLGIEDHERFALIILTPAASTTYADSLTPDPEFDYDTEDDDYDYDTDDDIDYDDTYHVLPLEAQDEAEEFPSNVDIIINADTFNHFTQVEGVGTNWSATYSQIGLLWVCTLIILFKDKTYEIVTKPWRSKAIALYWAKIQTLVDLSNVLKSPLEAQDEVTTTEAKDNETEVLAKESTILVENRDASLAVPLPFTVETPESHSFGFKSYVYPNWLSRWTNIGTFRLTPSDVAGSIIQTIRLPYDVFSRLPDNVMVRPFAQHTYVRPQMTVRFQVNSTNFHQGMYIAGVKYYGDNDYNAVNPEQTPTNAAQVYQLHFAELNIASTNPAELQIPFMSHLDMIPTHLNNAVGSSMYYASIYLACVSPLKTGPDNLQEVAVSTQVSFTNGSAQTEFFGLQPELPLFASASVLEAQDVAGTISGIANGIGSIANIAGAFGVPGAGLLGGLVGTVGNVVSSVIRPIEGIFGGLGSLFKSGNQDRPIDPREPEMLIRSPTVQLSRGTGVTHGHILRLNPATTTPHHPANVPKTSDLTDASICRNWGFVHITIAPSQISSVTTSTTPGTLLGWIPITPLLFSFTPDGILPTPLAGVVSMFQFFCGSLEFKFQVIKANVHSLRLRFVTIPAEYPNWQTDPEAWLSTESVVYDFEERSEYVHTVPYQAPTQVAPITHVSIADETAVQVPYYGVLAVYLETQLVSMASVSDTVDILAFSRAGPDFEFAAPQTTFFKPLIEPPGLQLEAQDEQQRTSADDIKSNGLLIKASPIQLVTGESFPLRDTLKRFEALNEFTLDVPAAPAAAWMQFPHCPQGLHRTSNTITNFTWCSYGWRFYKGSIDYLFRLLLTPGDLWMTAYYDSRNTDDIKLDLTTTYLPTRNLMGHEICTTRDLCVPISVPYYNSTGKLINGYNFAAGTLSLGDVAAYSAGSIVVRVNLPSYTGTTTTPVIIGVERRMGDDGEFYCFQGWPVCVVPPITYVSASLQSSFPATTERLYKPRHVLVAQDLEEPCEQTLTPPPSPEKDFRADSFLLALCFGEKKRTRVSARLLLKKYGNYLRRLYPDQLVAQDDIEFSQSDIDNFDLLSVLLSEFLLIGYDDTLAVRIETLIHQLNAMVFENDELTRLRDVLTFELEQGCVDAELWFMFKQQAITNYLGLYTHMGTKNNVFFHSIGVAPPGLSWMKRSIWYIKKHTGALPDALRVPADFLLQIAADAEKTPNDYIALLKEQFTDRHRLISMVFSLIYILQANDLHVRVLAFAQLGVQFGFIQSTKIPLIIALLVYLGNKAKPRQFILTAQDEADDEKIGQFASLILGGVAATCAFSSSHSWAKGVAEFCRILPTVANSFQRLFSTTLKFALKYVYYLFGMEHPQAVAIRELKELGLDIAEWAKEVLELTDPAQNAVVKADPAKRHRVSELYDIGSRLAIAVTNQPRTTPGIATFFNVHRRLCDLYEETGEVSDSLAANIQPLCIWVAGEPGCGKSEMAKDLGIRVAKELGVTYRGDPVFVRTERKFWDGYTNQPIILFDDAMQMKGQEPLLTFCQDWFGLMTGAPFSPEFSSVSEKKRFVHPKVVIACANLAYPEPQVVNNTTAFFRRRDVVVFARFNAAFKQRHPLVKTCDNPEVPYSELQNFAHLEFGFCDHPTVKETPDQPRTYYNYEEFCKKVVSFTKPVYDKRMLNAKRKLEIADLLSPERVEEAVEQLLDVDVSAVVAGTPLEPIAALIDSAAALNAQDRMDLSGDCLCGCKDSTRGCMMCCDFSKAEYCFDHHVLTTRRRFCSPLVECTCWPERIRLGAGNVDGVSLETLKHKLHMLFAAEKERLKGRGDLLAKQVVVPSTTYRPKQTNVFVDKIAKCFEFLNGFSLWKFVLEHARFGMVLLAVGLVALLIYCKYITPLMLFLGLTGPDEQPSTLSPQIASSGDTKTKSAARSHYSSSATFKPTLRAQDQESASLAQLLFRNRIKVKLNFETMSFTGYGLGIRGRYFVMAKHSFGGDYGSLVSVDLTLFGNGKEGGTIRLFPDSIVTNDIEGDIDLTLVQVVDRKIPEFRNIMSRMIRPNEVPNIHLQEAALMNCTESVMGFHHFDMIRPWKSTLAYANKSHDRTYTIDGFSYPIGVQGMCGSVLVDTHTWHVIGFHVAGNTVTGGGISQLLHQGMFKDFKFEGHDDVEEPDLQPGGSVNPSGNFIPIGMVAQDQSVRLPCKTTIRQSECVGIFADPVRFPAKLKERGELVPGLSILEETLPKYGKPTLPFRKDLIKIAEDDLTHLVISKAKPVIRVSPKRSLNDAVLGVEGVEFMQALRGDSSPGYPLVVKHPGKKKRDFLMIDDEHNLTAIHKDLAEEYQHQHDLRLRNIRPYDPFMVFQKDERLKPGKATRLIEGSSFASSIEARRYGLMDFAAAIMANRLDIGVGLGMNVHGMEWTLLAERLGAGKKRIAAGDYKGFGPQLDPELVLTAFRIAFKWIKFHCPEHPDLAECERILTSLGEELAFSYMICIETVFETLCGAPSGNQFTSLINSLVNLLYIRVAWLTIMDGTEFGNMLMFYMYVYINATGDDVVISIADEVLEYFNNSSLQDFFAHYGITYTDADKSNQIRKHCDLSEVSYLKHVWRPHPTRPGVYIAQLDWDMVVDIPNWIRKCADPIGASMENTTQSLRLMYAYGPEVYARYCGIASQFWAGLGEHLPVESWQYLDAASFGEIECLSYPFQYV